MVATYQKKPVRILAAQLTHSSVNDVKEFAGLWFEMLPPEERGSDGVVAKVYDVLHATWVGVKFGQWIIKGIEGEFYPCDNDVFWNSYERIYIEGQ